MSFQLAVTEAQEAIAQTIKLKLDQFHKVAPKNSNSAIAGDFIEELVTGLIRDWIQPCCLLNGTMFPNDLNPQVADPRPKQIDGIVFDPRLGPPIIREGSFVVAHPKFCRGIIEIKKSANSTDFTKRLQELHQQYLFRRPLNTVMGIIIHDRDPESSSRPDVLRNAKHCGGGIEPTLYDPRTTNFCPIFILFREVKNGDGDLDYIPHMPAIGHMMATLFGHEWGLDPRIDDVRREIRNQLLLNRNR